MSPIVTVAFGTLWVTLFALAWLVIMLYRQVEKGYRTSAAVKAAGLTQGTRVESVAIVAGDGERDIEFGDDDGLTVVGFVTSDCPACKSVLEEIRDVDLEVDRLIIFVSGESVADLPQPSYGEMYWVAHPPDVVRDWSVSAVPLFYVLDQDRIRMSGAGASFAALRGLVAEARELGAKLEPSLPGT